MVSRRDLLLGLGASVVALATLPGCQPAVAVRGPQQSRRDVEAWAIAAVDELVRHGSAAWCQVIRTQHVELVLDVIGESQALVTTWQLQLGITRPDGSSENRTITQISQGTVETTVAAMIGATQWRWAPPQNPGPAIQAYGALQPVVQRTPQQPWREALRQLHATLVPMLHSRIIYHAVALQQQVHERWSYHRTRDQAAGQKFAATVTRQLWQCTTATRQRDQVDFVYAHRGSSKPTPAPEFTDGELQNLIDRALRHATPSDPPRGAIQVLLAPDITASLLLAAAQRTELAVPQLQFDPLQAEAYGRTPWRDSELPTQAVATSPVATGPTVAAAGRDAHAVDEPAHFSIAGGTAALTTLRDQPTAVYLLEAADISVSHTGAILIWPSWALELVRGVTSGRAYRMPIVRTTLAAINTAQASSDRATVVVPAPLELAAVSSAGAPAPPTTMWSATAPWLLLPAEFA